MEQNKNIKRSDGSKATTRIASFDYIRTTAILLVLLHHAVLAYTTFAYLNPANPIDTFSPVVDSQMWSGFDLIALFNDTYFMALLFFISGFFVWRSISGKGTRIFLRDRFIRLGIPFVIGVLFLIPLAYFPAQLEVELIFGGNTNYIDFWSDMIRTGFRTSGPLWFLWLLLAFNVLIVVLYRLAHHLGGIIIKRTLSIFNRPLAFFGVLFGISTVAYMPMLLVFGIDHWTTIGPITFQTSRILLYLAYFLVGTAVGVYGLERTMFNSNSKFARRGWIWMVVSPVSFIVMLIFLVNPTGLIVYGMALPFTCAAAVLGLIAIFLRFTKQRVDIIDNLSNNAFGIYIIHYSIVTWLQYWLLDANLHAIHKASIVFAGTLILSWGLIAAIRRISVVARVI
ncbi:MAG: acyltransferase [Methanocellales archaeon]|nr:acyltransferase [Methanocellales archaeon]